MAVLSFTEFSNLLSYSAADKYVEAMSDITTRGRDLQLENLERPTERSPQRGLSLPQDALLS